jgi:glucose/mannose-6-phosphate isomerase
MINLDSREDVLRLDPKEMHRLTCEFSDQVKQALEIAENSSLPTWGAKPDNVILTGMGGSAAGGDFVGAMFDALGTVPFLVNRDYSLPNWAGSGSLVFAASYSGNTEETLAAYDQAKKLGANIIAVTSGGKLADQAAADGFPVIGIPGGQPPRTALGFLMMPVLAACIKLGLLPDQDFERLISLLKDSADAWRLESPESQNPTKQMARELYGKPVVLYGLGSWQGAVAGRWKGQICENAKEMCFSHAYPELCHNEILGWVKANEQCSNGWGLVTLRDGTESPKMEARGRITADLVSHAAKNQYATAIGDTLLEKMMTLTLFGDFVSLYLAAMNEVDPESIDSINILKAELVSVPLR